MAKASVKHFYKPTPPFWRKLGDALLSVGGMTGLIAIGSGFDKWIGITLVACSIAGKFLSNFFKVEEK